MPLIDLPLSELALYEGRNPRPADFDEYWDRALGELDSVNLNPVFKKNEFGFAAGIAEDLYFTGVRGARIHAKVMTPTWVEPPYPTVLVFHGYSGRAPEWWGLMPWVAAGYAVYALDCRGQAGESDDVGGVTGTTLRGHIVRGLSGDPDDFLMRHIFLDCAAIGRIALTNPSVDADRLFSTGASQGGGLSLVAAALEPRISRCAPVYPFLSDYLRTWEMDLARDAYQELRDYLRNYDPEHQRLTEIFTKLGYIDIQFLARRVRAKVEMHTGLMDTITPPSTQFAMYNRLNGDKSVRVYPDFGHEGLPNSSETILKFFAK